MATHQELLQQLSTLSNTYPSLGTRLGLAAGELQNLGTPPAEGLVDELDRYRKTFAAARDAALAIARESGMAAASIPSNLVSVRELEAFVKSLSPVGSPEVVQQSAIALLDRILGATYQGQEGFQALADCQTQARQLRNTIASASPASLPQAAISLVQGKHPFCDLLVLAEGEALDDERWGQLQDAVSQAFGRGLAAAASRGRLQIPPAPQGVQAGVQPGAQTAQPARLGAADLVLGGAPVAPSAGPAAAVAPVAATPVKTVGLKVRVHIQGIGDRDFRGDEFAGTRGEARALEGLQIELDPPVPGLGLSYMAHLQGLGDTPWLSGGQYAGTRGQNRRLEGFAVKLTGPEAEQYNICYIGHFSQYGDSNPMSNGQLCGMRGQGLKLEALKIWVEPR